MGEVGRSRSQSREQRMEQLPTTAGQGLFLQSFCISSILGGQMQEVRPQGKHCSYNAFAFPPSVEVRWRT